MGGRRIYHARGKVLGGSSSINGQIFQRGNPLDYERWAADPGMATWDYAHCLPYFKRMETCLAAAADDPWRGHDGPLVLERGPATNPLFTAFFEACQQAGYHLTEDVNGYRQEGFAPFDRNIHKGRRLSAARAYLHPVMGRKNLTVRTRTFVTRIVFEGRRAVGRRGRQGRRSRGDPRRRDPPVRRRHQLAATAATLRCGPGRGPRGARDPDGRRPAGRRRPPAGPPRGLHPVQEPAARLDAAVRDAEVATAVHRGAVAVPAQRSRRDESLRGGRVRPQQRRRRVPEPDVPLPPAGDPLRRERRSRWARLPGPRRADVLRRARHRVAHEHGPAGAPRAALQLPLDRAGPTRVGRGGERLATDPRPAGDGPVQRRRDVARPGRHQRRRDPRLGGSRRGDRAAPVVHRPDGGGRRLGPRPVDDAGPRPGRAAGGRRVRDAVRHQRQHLRAGDDARGEGRGPDHRQHAARAPDDARSIGTSRPARSTGARARSTDPR